MRILYYNAWNIGHFPHFLPYYKELGGLIYLEDEKLVKQLKYDYEGINITSNTLDILKYGPDIILYADYHKILRSMKAKHVMIGHSIEWKGYFAQRKDWNNCEEFDLYLLYGQHILDEFKANNWSINHKIIGYPRFDDIQTITDSIFKNKRKTILVAPTWSGESLLNKFTNDIIKLSKTYNIIVKPHSMTLNYKDYNYKYIKQLLQVTSNTLKICLSVDILPLMKYSDMLITDISGCSSEYMYFNKPIIILDNNVLPAVSKKKPDIWKVFKVCENSEEIEKVIASQFINDEMRYFRQDKLYHCPKCEKKDLKFYSAGNWD